jgi:hypothetical protein
MVRPPVLHSGSPGFDSRSLNRLFRPGRSWDNVLKMLLRKPSVSVPCARVHSLCPVPEFIGCISEWASFMRVFLYRTIFFFVPVCEFPVCLSVVVVKSVLITGVSLVSCRLLCCSNCRQVLATRRDVWGVNPSGFVLSQPVLHWYNTVDLSHSSLYCNVNRRNFLVIFFLPCKM